MTREEAIENLKVMEMAFYYCRINDDVVADADTAGLAEILDETLNMAIKALDFDMAIKGEFLLDKIRAEIDLKQYDFMADKDYDEGVRFGLMLAYQIIGKYKTESEDKKMTENERKAMMKIANTIKGEINKECVTKELTEDDTPYKAESKEQKNDRNN